MPFGQVEASEIYRGKGPGKTAAQKINQTLA